MSATSSFLMLIPRCLQRGAFILRSAVWNFIHYYNAQLANSQLYHYVRVSTTVCHSPSKIRGGYSGLQVSERRASATLSARMKSLSYQIVPQSREYRYKAQN
jgi:hypothetical protein